MVSAKDKEENNIIKDRTKMTENILFIKSLSLNFRREWEMQENTFPILHLLVNLLNECHLFNFVESARSKFEEIKTTGN